MTNNNIFNKNNSINSTVRNKNKIKISVYAGVTYVNGEIPPIEIVSQICQENSLDFSCEENSEYLPLI